MLLLYLVSSDLELPYGEADDKPVGYFSDEFDRPYFHNRFFAGNSNFGIVFSSQFTCTTTQRSPSEFTRTFRKGSKLSYFFMFPR